MKKKIRIALIGWICLICLLVTGCGDTKEEDPIQDARTGVVRVVAMCDNGTIGSGTAFAVGTAGEKSDIFVTNWHVVTDSGNPCDLYIVLSDDAIKYQIGLDQNGNTTKTVTDINWDELMPCTLLQTTTGYPDCAIIQSNEVLDGIKALPLLKAEEASVSDTVYAIGFPGDADYYSSDVNGEGYYYGETDDVLTTQGIISRFTKLANADNTSVIQHEAEINHGNSGGPLLTEDGAVIGINTYMVGESDYPTSVYIDYAMDMLDGLGISYDTYVPHQELPDWLIPVAAVILVLVAALIIVFLLLRKHKDQQEEQISEIREELEREQERNSRQETKQPQQKEGNWDSGYRIQGVSGYFAGKRFALGKSVKLGRSTHNNLVYPGNSQKISKNHCELQVQNQRLYIIDCGSTNGTYLEGGRKIPAQTWVELKPGMTFYVGSKEEGFRIDRK